MSVDFIFNNGNKLYKAEKNKTDYHINWLIKNITNCKLDNFGKGYVTDYIHDMCNNSDGNIYGDDFKIQIINQNVENNVALIIADYDENQNKECEIVIDFTKDELEHLIFILQKALR